VSDELFLVRHGETVHNVSGITQGWSDSALSERGFAQVRALAARVAQLKPDAIFCSPLERAMSTARPIAEATGLEIVALDDLREMNYGRWEGQSFRDIRANDADAARRWMEDPDCPCPGGESHNDVRERMVRAFAVAAGSARPVIVTHGTAIRIGATVLLNAPVALSRHLAQDNASINVFSRRGERMLLKLWNDTSHCVER
jgi:broad specificity phosphatase PhoE